MTTTWDKVLTDRVGARGHWVTLPGNGWGALVAYLAGPGHVRAVPREHDAVRTTCVVDGTAQTRLEAVSAEEIARQDAEIASYLRRYGVPAPPPDVSLQIRLPAGASRLSFERAVNAATLSAAPDGDPAAERRAIQALLPDLLAP